MDYIRHGTLTETGKLIGSQLVNLQIEKNRDAIINLVHSTPPKALKVILEYQYPGEGIRPKKESFSYPAKRPTKIIEPYNAISGAPLNLKTFAHDSRILLSQIRFDYWDLKSLSLAELIPAIHHKVELNIYRVFTNFEKTWDIGDKFFYGIHNIGLSFVNAYAYTIPRELRSFIISLITDCNLDDEIKRMLVATILSSMNEKYDPNLIYRIIKETSSENEIKDIIKNMADSGITTKYIYQPGTPPFLVIDSQKYFEYIETNIFTPVMENIIRKQTLSPPVTKPVETIQETKQKLLQRIQSAHNNMVLQPVLNEIGTANLPSSEKRQLLDIYQYRFSILKR